MQILNTEVRSESQIHVSFEPAVGKPDSGCTCSEQETHTITPPCKHRLDQTSAVTWCYPVRCIAAIFESFVDADVLALPLGMTWSRRSEPNASGESKHS